MKIYNIYPFHSDIELPQLIRLHQTVFPNDAQNTEQRKQWILSKKSAVDNEVGYYFGAIESTKLLGYIYWTHIEGIRDSLELEQIGIGKEYQKQGIGTKLIDDSIVYLEIELRKKVFNGIGKIRVTTSTNNDAQKLYKKTLGAEVVAIEPKLYDGDEAIMHARREQINGARKERGLKTLDEIF